MSGLWQWIEINKNKTSGSALVIRVGSSLNAGCLLFFLFLTAWWHSISIVDGLSSNEIRLPMSISHWNQQFLVNMLTLDSTMTMEGLDLAACADDLLLLRTSRTATFTLGSSSSSSASLECLQDAYRNESLPDLSASRHTTESRLLTHSQSLTIECQRRRPVIKDPYRLSPNLHVLNEWMIVSSLDYCPRSHWPSLRWSSPTPYRVHSVGKKWLRWQKKIDEDSLSGTYGSC